MKKKLAAIGLCCLLSACSSSAPVAKSSSAPPEPPEPKLSLSVPQVTVGSQGEAVVESQGLDGQDVALYVFREDFDKTSRCQDAAVKPVVFKLQDGAQTISFDAATPGDLWLVLASSKFSTTCGAAKTRVLVDPAIELLPGCTGEGANYSCPMVWADGSAGKDFLVNVRAAGSAGKLVVAVRALGPFESIPDAHTSSCEAASIAAQEKVELSSSSAEKSQSRNVALRLSRAGVYRLVASSSASERVAGFDSDCSSAPLIVIK